MLFHSETSPFLHKRPVGNTQVTENNDYIKNSDYLCDDNLPVPAGKTKMPLAQD
jgi:hypothetical protein